MSEFQKVSWQLLLNFIKGEATEKEKELVEKWLEDDLERQKLLSQLRQIWDSPAEKKQNWDVEGSWYRFREQYGAVKDKDLRVLGSYQDVSLGNSKRSRKYFGARFGYSIAAGFILILIVVFAVMNMPVDEAEKPSMQEIITQRGERTTLKLSDGSRVMLNSKSALQIPSNYGEYSRTIYLQGEAFFEVTHNEEKPFIVYAGNTYTEDLGTKFNIRTYDPTEPVKVVVSEGLVEVGNKNQSQEPAVINPNQMGIVRENGSVSISEVEDLSVYLGWTKGKLVFKDEPFREVRKELERWYDITTSVSDSSIDNKRLTATFEDEPLTEVLNVIAISFQIDYTREKRRVIFKLVEKLKIKLRGD